MKKRLLLVPIFGGLLLAGCKITLFGKTIYLFEKKPTEDTTPFKGLSFDSDKLEKAANEADPDGRGYAKYAAVSEIDGVPVSFNNVMANHLDESSLPKWTVPEGTTADVIQMKKNESDNGGTITVTGMVKKLTLKIFSSRDFAETSLPTISVEGKDIAAPTSAKSTEATEYASWNSSGTKSYAVKIITCEYSINLKSVKDVEIRNKNAYALYCHSFTLA